MKKVLVTKQGSGKFVNATFEDCIADLNKAISRDGYMYFQFAPSSIPGNKPLAEDFEDDKLLDWAVHHKDLEFQEENIETKEEYNSRLKKEREEMEKQAEELKKAQAQA